MPLSMAIDARRSSEDGTSTHLSTSTILIVLVRIENHAHPIFSLVIGYLEKFIRYLQGTSPTPIRLPTVAQQSIEPCVRYANSYVEVQHSYWSARNTTLQKSCLFDFNRSKFLHSDCWMMKSLLVLTLLVAAASAHLCLLSPRQRGTMEELNTQGENNALMCM